MEIELQKNTLLYNCARAVLYLLNGMSYFELRPRIFETKIKHVELRTTKETEKFE